MKGKSGEETRRGKARPAQTEADNQPTLERLAEINQLEERRDKLKERLDIGAERINEARDKGKDVREWEDFWIGLLRQYEQVCKELEGKARSY